MRAALDAPLLVRDTLQCGFWPTSRITTEVEDQIKDDGTLCEEYAEDAPFVGRRCDRPHPSFRVDRDVYAGYFVVVHPAQDDPKPFWLAMAITNPNPDSGHLHMIRIQYWMPIASRHINLNTYAGWDTKEGNVWREDRAIKPDWSNTDCIMTAWKPCGKKMTNDAPQVITRVTISKVQINIINTSVAAFETNSVTALSSAKDEE